MLQYLNNLTSTAIHPSHFISFLMAFGNLLRLRRLQRSGKVSVFVLLTCSISYFVFTFSKRSHSSSGSASGKHQEARADGGVLNVRIWRSLCGSNVANLRRSPFFPRYPDEEKSTADLFQIEDDRADYGQLIFGYILTPSEERIVPLRDSL